MRKILWASDNPLLPTGYAQVTRNVGSRLKKAGFDFTALAFQQFSMPLENVQTPDEWINFPIKPCLRFNEFYGNMGSIETWINVIKPELALFLCDAFMIRHLLDVKVRDNILERDIDRIKAKTRLAMYFPFDSADVYEGADAVLEQMDYRIAMSRFGQDLLKKQTGMDSHYIPHGVDTTIFRRLPDAVRFNIKKQMGLEGKFVIGAVFRNQTRKLPTKLITAFKKFSEDKDDVCLLLHCDPNDPQGQNLPEFIKQIKMDENKVKFTRTNFISGHTLHDLNMIYNAMDIHALSTTGEGFGLPIIEAHATGIPNVVTDYTTSRELMEGHGMLVKVKNYIEGQKNTQRAMIDTDHMAECFDRYYRNRKLTERHGRLAQEDVLNKYSWEKVVRMWIEYLEAI
jgi:glycosyltransferase involved in cell wall biosynthesis